MSLKRTGQRPLCSKSGRSKVGHLSTLALVLFSLQRQQQEMKKTNCPSVEKNPIALNVSTICHASTLPFHGHGPKSNLVHYQQ